MTDKPIIFSAPMVRALLDGRKTQTRRVLKQQPSAWAEAVEIAPYRSDDGDYGKAGGLIQRTLDDQRQHGCGKLAYAPGDRLWVKEALRSVSERDADGTIADCISYAADGAYPEHGLIEWPLQRAALPSIHMPRWVSRITLTVTDVRVQRLQEISRGDAMGEGCPFPNMAKGPNPRDWYRDIWNSLHGPEAWDANPWVVALTFTVDRRNIDAQETKP